MQGSGYFYTILPQLRKIYGDDTPELKEIMKTHTQFFNTSNFFNTIITGIDLAIEEKEGIASKETVSGMKAGLMGSFAAIGDSVFAALIPTIFGALAANMAPMVIQRVFLSGSLLRSLSWSFVGNNRICLQRRDFSSYHDAITIDCIDRCGNFIGVFMVGALVATMINVKFSWAPRIGDVTLNMQNYIDMIYLNFYQLASLVAFIGC